VGQRIGGQGKTTNSQTLDERIQHSLNTLEELGGAAQVASQNGTIVIKSESCPFAETVTEHPEVCQVAEAMMEEMIGAPVREKCDRSGSPKCCFEISPPSST
jgi:predicted ArsR family transcriptional regulator